MFLYDEEEVRDSPQEKMEDGTASAACSLRRESDGDVAMARCGSNEGGAASMARRAASKVIVAPRPVLEEE
jgi:hypothetical protein